MWTTESLPQCEDGRSYITAELMCEQRHIAEMVRRQPDFWLSAPNNWDVWIAKEPGEIPVRIEVFDGQR
jgi:hypothetical protein